MNKQNRNLRIALYLIIFLLVLILIKNNSEQKHDNIMWNIGDSQGIAKKSDNKILAYELLPNYSNEVEGVFLNSAGFRDEEFSYNKKNNTFRIAVLGDSVTFGLYINDSSKILTEILEKQLNKGNSSIEFEVMNFGVGGYSLIQERVLLQEKVLKYYPDLIIIVFFPNDVDEEFLYSIKHWFTKEEYYKRAKTKSGLLDETTFCKLKRKYQGTGLAQKILSITKKINKPKTILEFWRNEWDKVYSNKCYLNDLESNFKSIKSIVSEYNIPVIIVNQPFIYWDEGEYSAEKAEQVISELSGKNGFYFLSVKSEYMNYRTEKIGNKYYPTDKDHPSELGHNISGTKIYNYLLKNNIPST
ncbi:SGNH/GDSL hydrolase family protein [Bacteroidota bacterium]